MPKRTQYPIHAKLDLPESLRPEVTTVDRWFQPFSEPVRLAAGVLAAASLLTSGATDVTNIWPQQVTPSAPTISQDSMVGAVQRTQYQAVAEPIFFEVEDVTGPGPEEIEWYVPPSEPVRPAKTFAYLMAGEVHANEELPEPPAAAPDIDWLAPLSGPIPPPKHRQTAGEIAASPFIGPEATDPGKWYQPLSEPVLPPLPRQAAGDASPPAFFGPEVTSLDKWFQQLSFPIFTRSFHATLIASGETHANEILPSVGWAHLLSQSRNRLVVGY